MLQTTVFHSVREEDLRDICPYCKREIDPTKFVSEHHVFLHYKTFECECGRKLSVKVDFGSDGNDNWGKEKSIEAKIMAAQREKEEEKNEQE